MRKLFSGIILALLLASMLAVAFKVQSVRAAGPVWNVSIYILADGSVSPSTAPIHQNGNVYTLTGNITTNATAVVVQKSNITVDGAGYTLMGNISGYGFSLNRISNVIIKNTTITNFNDGIWLNSSSTNTVSGNNITNNYNGIELTSSSGNTISGNNITSNNGDGIILESSSFNNTVSGNDASNEYDGVLLRESFNNTVSGNSMTNCEDCGICLLADCWYNTVSGNNVTGNERGIFLIASCSYNTISGTNITNNYEGITFTESSIGNIIYHNNFVDNTVQASTSGLTNVWDDGYPSGGNYWSNYTGVDERSGSGQNLTGSDGIGDTPQVIDSNNTDHYPLMGPFRTFTAGTWNAITYQVDIVSNSTTTNFNFNPTTQTIKFNVEGKIGTTGFCRVTIPTSLLSCNNTDEWIVKVDGAPTSYSAITLSGDYTYIYFAYTQSTHQVTITGLYAVPEFQSLFFLLLFIIAMLLATLLAALVPKRKRSARTQ